MGIRKLREFDLFNKLIMGLDSNIIWFQPERYPQYFESL